MYSEVRNSDSLVFEVMNGPSRIAFILQTCMLLIKICRLIWNLR